MEITYDLRANAWRRLANMLIDFFVVCFLFILLMLIGIVLDNLGSPGFFRWLSGFNDGDYNVMALIIMSLYYIIMESLTQKTVGKIITGTMVVGNYGNKPQITAIIGRSLCRLFSIEALSFLSTKPRGWHDKAASTYVVNAKAFKAALERKNSFEEIGAVAE